MIARVLDGALCDFTITPSTPRQVKTGVAVVTVVTCAPSDGRHKFVAIACSHLCPDENHPVCAVDAQGLPKTFANRCFVDFAYCREGKCTLRHNEGRGMLKWQYDKQDITITIVIITIPNTNEIDTITDRLRAEWPGNLEVPEKKRFFQGNSFG
ncbi:hypothetical protein RUM43_007482 [Polyplax serrata]|uniref:Kazal-like domain-containing protein n=1 Tax=Polyplax serrata TaxID=468196 RepID=A0AAN8S7W4_POLSC